MSKSPNSRDIEYLKLKLQYYVLNEQYEKAETIKKWIIDLGGNPTIENEDKSIKSNKKN
jgi:hypothetical protein